jgi:hypothetical protein
MSRSTRWYDLALSVCVSLKALRSHPPFQAHKEFLEHLVSPSMGAEEDNVDALLQVCNECGHRVANVSVSGI